REVTCPVLKSPRAGQIRLRSPRRSLKRAAATSAERDSIYTRDAAATAKTPAERRCGICAPPALAPHRAGSGRVVSCRPRFTTAATPCPSPTAAATALSPTVAAPLSCSPPLLTAAPRR